MATERQRKANRRNGRKGGPKTDEGKQRSRANSLKHGLTSSTLVVLPEEDRQEYDEVLRGFRDSLNPEGDVEGSLVLRLAQAHWRSLRSRRIESGILQVSADIQRGRARQWVENSPQHLDLHEAIGVGFMADPAERWQMYLRYDTIISRDFFKTLDSLTKLQRLRQRQTKPAEPESPPPLVFTAGAGAQLSDSGIRSVSQNGTSGVAVTETPAPASVPPQSTRKFEHRRRTLRGARLVADPAMDTPERVGGKQSHLRRLLKADKVLSRYARRANQKNASSMGR